jgi:hypothetical protein
VPLGAVVEALVLLLLERRVARVAGDRRHLRRPPWLLGSGLDQLRRLLRRGGRFWSRVYLLAGGAWAVSCGWGK